MTGSTEALIAKSAGAVLNTSTDLLITTSLIPVALTLTGKTMLTPAKVETLTKVSTVMVRLSPAGSVPKFQTASLVGLQLLQPVGLGSAFADHEKLNSFGTTNDTITFSIVESVVLPTLIVYSKRSPATAGPVTDMSVERGKLTVTFKARVSVTALVTLSLTVRFAV